MAIPKNAVNFRDHGEALARALDKYEEVCSWILARSNIPALISGNVRLHAAADAINQIMSGQTIASFEPALRDIFQLDAAQWQGFMDSAISVHTVLVPNAIALIEAQSGSILAQSFGPDGVPVPSGTLSQAAANSIRSALQAVVAEYA